MASPDVANFKKSFKKIMDKWVKIVEKPLKNIEKINEELDALDTKKGKPSAEDEKRRKACIALRGKLQKEVEKANLEFRTELMLITPPAKAPKSDIDKLITWIKSVYKTVKQGLPLGKGFVLQPDVEFDFKKLKFKKLGAILKWSF